jgi:negative regulator of sigma-B (phosphoserine phosphatase)
MEVVKPDTLEWGVSSRIHPGETQSGDAYVVDTLDGGGFVAVIDALGHGNAAAHAAKVAVRTLQEHGTEALASLLQRCHARLRTTRGAAISMAYFDRDRQTMTWLGVGNVVGVLVYADPKGVRRVKPLLVRSGVIGDRLPDLSPLALEIRSGDTLLLATDGIREDFTETLPNSLDPQPLADRILDAYATRDDDALVVVVRYKRDFA